MTAHRRPTPPAHRARGRRPRAQATPAAPSSAPAAPSGTRPLLHPRTARLAALLAAGSCAAVLGLLAAGPSPAPSDHGPARGGAGPHRPAAELTRTLTWTPGEGATSSLAWVPTWTPPSAPPVTSGTAPTQGPSARTAPAHEHGAVGGVLERLASVLGSPAGSPAGGVGPSAGRLTGPPSGQPADDAGATGAGPPTVRVQVAVPLGVDEVATDRP